jgi:heat shock protein HtpX
VDLYRQQAGNRRMTWLFLGGFVALFAGVGWAVDLEMPMRAQLMLGSQSVGVPIAPVGALGFSAMSALYSYYQGDKLVLGAMKARALDESNLKERQLKNVVEEMAIASGLPVPAVYIVPDDDLNAFATGRSPQHASLGVTEGLLEAMDREELQAVVAHEMGHIRNLDIRTMMVVSVLLGALGLICDMVLRAGSGRSRKQSAGALSIIIALVTPLIARLLAMAVSRTREFEADRSAAEFTRNPLALARALAKLEAAQEPTRIATQGTAHLFIIDPRISKLNEREDWLGNLFATHPPVQARIKRLEAMGYGQHAEVA